MRRSVLRGLLVLATTASIGLATLATTAANAATSHPGHPVTVTSVHLRGPVVTPYTVTTKAVYPRLSIPGCSRQDGYNGNVQWGSVPNPTFVATWGQLWDVCGVRAYLYMSWYAATYNNVQVATTPPLITTGVNRSYSTSLNPGYISVTVCANTINGWTCGSPYGV